MLSWVTQTISQSGSRTVFGRFLGASIWYEMVVFWLFIGHDWTVCKTVWMNLIPWTHMIGPCVKPYELAHSLDTGCLQRQECAQNSAQHAERNAHRGLSDDAGVQRDPGDRQECDWDVERGLWDDGRADDFLGLLRSGAAADVLQEVKELW